MTVIVPAPGLIDPASVDAALAANKTLPMDWYWRPEIHDFELSGIFNRTWHLAGPLQSVSEPGDQLLCQAGLVPIVVVRGRDGVLRGFINACRHRGYAVANGERSPRALVCGYHGWAYGLDGKLIGAPRCGRGEFDDEPIALLPVAVEVWRNLVFVNPDAGAESLAVTFPELDATADALELDFDTGYRYVGVSTFEIAGNWKAWCENTNECYHCPKIHKGSFDKTFKSLRDREVVLTKNLIGAINGYREQAELLERHGEHPTFGEHYVYLFPGTFISKDDYLAFAGCTVPDGPERTRFVSHMWLRDGVDPAFLEDWNAMWDRTLHEDAEAVRVQQLGLRSRVLDHGRLSGEADTMTLKLHELIWRGYRRALAATH